MSTFPALAPSSRTFTPGDYPHSAFTGLGGQQARVRNSTVMLSSQLRVSFIALTEAQMLSILSHYNGQQGNYLSFDIPSTLLSGVTAADYTLSGYAWRYIEPPQVEDLGLQRHTVTLTLESVPGEGATVGGLELQITCTLAAGAAFGQPNSPVAAGFTLQVVAIFDGGAFTNGTDVQTSRRDWTILATFTPGAADGNLASGGAPYWLDWEWQASDILPF